MRIQKAKKTIVGHWILVEMQFIVCEQTGDWTSALRRWLPGISLFETRNLFEIWDRLDVDPASVVGIEFNAAKADAILAAIVRINRNFPHSRCVVFMPRALHAWDQVIRESGAIHVVYSPRSLGQVSQLVDRHARNLHATARVNDETAHTLEARILSALPWSE
jgi:hypothetical protein